MAVLKRSRACSSRAAPPGSTCSMPPQGAQCPPRVLNAPPGSTCSMHASFIARAKYIGSLGQAKRPRACNIREPLLACCTARQGVRAWLQQGPSPLHWIEVTSVQPDPRQKFKADLRAGSLTTLLQHCLHIAGARGDGGRNARGPAA